ncbi:hypothetical protein BC827DRAFT_1232116, partial [Russula dissimulans]
MFLKRAAATLMGIMWHITQLTKKLREKMLLEPYPCYAGTLQNPTPIHLVTLVTHGKPQSPFLVQIPSLVRCCLGP